ncbi:MAG: hypothetical protein JXR75_13770 [Rhodobacteraceae bacterium]|nr:hypothetical protein [Paracoccaceae bacterium]
MVALRVAAWVAFGFSAVAFILLVNDGFLPFLGAALGLALMGALLLAADRVLVVLIEIRDALRGVDSAASGSPAETAQAKKLEPRSMAEIAGDLDRMKRKR